LNALVLGRRIRNVLSKGRDMNQTSISIHRVKSISPLVTAIDTLDKVDILVASRVGFEGREDVPWC